MNATIDFNCDLGEGMSNDELIMPFITSANIACGGHAGNRDTMQQTIELALRHGVAIGAHPSFPDRANFGRRDMLAEGLSLETLQDALYDQLHNLSTLCGQHGATIHHLKPHGALYNRAAWDRELAAILINITNEFDSKLIIYALSGSELTKIAQQKGMQCYHEVFADRAYADDGSLLPRSEPGALHEDPARALAQSLRFATEGKVETITGKLLQLKADTLCIHGDGSMAAHFAKLIHDGLLAKGVRIKA